MPKLPAEGPESVQPHSGRPPRSPATRSPCGALGADVRPGSCGSSQLRRANGNIWTHPLSWPDYPGVWTNFFLPTNPDNRTEKRMVHTPFERAAHARSLVLVDQGAQALLAQLLHAVGAELVGRPQQPYQEASVTLLSRPRMGCCCQGGEGSSTTSDKKYLEGGNCIHQCCQPSQSGASLQ